MTTWSFRDALEELEVRGHFDESVLRSALGLHLGDIHFAEIQTSIKMHTVHLDMFLQFVEQGSFNADNMTPDGYSQTMAILLAFIPDQCLEDIKGDAIGNVIWRRGSPLGDISSINMVIESIHSILNTERKKSLLKHRAYMMLIGNYGGHMAYATDPPYCVVYAADYKNTSDPSKMTTCEPLNHAYAMVTSNMMVRRLLSLPNWEPVERKLTKGGRLVILKGVQFGPGLFPEIVILCNHMGPLVNSTTWQEVPFRTIGPFHAIDTIFPGLPRDLELFTAEEVAKLKELGILNLPKTLGTCCSFRHLYPLVGVRLCPPHLVHHLQILMHMVLGRPWWLIGMRNLSSLTVTRTVTPTLLTAALCGGGKLGGAWNRNRNHGPKSTRTEMATSLVTRTVTEITTGNVIDPKRAITNMVQIGLTDALHDAKTTMANAAVMASMRDCTGMRVHSTAAKQSRDVEWVPVHRMAARSCTLPNVNLCHLRPCFIQQL